MKIEEILYFMDDLLDISEFPDYGNALNGLQVEGPSEVTSVAAAVDASEEVIRAAVDREADLLLVHHGLFWGGLRPATGRRFRKLSALIEGEVALYSAHLPLDAHPEVGNCAILARELGLELEGRFGSYEGRAIGWWGRTEMEREALTARFEEVVGGPVRLIPGGSKGVERVGVLTGGGASFIAEAHDRGLDALVTGEGAHHTYHDAMELGVNVYYGGHYATETWGVRSLARRLQEEFALPWTFIDRPTGL